MSDHHNTTNNTGENPNQGDYVVSGVTAFDIMQTLVLIPWDISLTWYLQPYSQVIPRPEPAPKTAARPINVVQSVGDDVTEKNEGEPIQVSISDVLELLSSEPCVTAENIKYFQLAEIAGLSMAQLMMFV